MGRRDPRHIKADDDARSAFLDSQCNKRGVAVIYLLSHWWLAKFQRDGESAVSSRSGREKRAPNERNAGALLED